MTHAGRPGRMPSGRLVRAAAAGVTTLGALLAAGCQGAYDLPLPGGAATGRDAYRVTAEFADVLDLVPQSSVKVDQVTVGTVERVELNGWTAKVTLRLPRSVALPDNAVAELKQTSLLGEKYVELAPPPTGAVGRLADGDNIPLARTGRNPEVEEVLSAMSLLLNGGGVAQLKVIEAELNNAIRGHEKDIQGLVTQLDTFVSGLDTQKAEIVRALDNLDRLAGRLARQKDQLAAVLDETPKGLKILADQRRQLTSMLTALSRLGDVGTRVIRASSSDTAANLAALQPILGELVKAGDDLPKSLQLLLTYPFPDSSLQGIRGDYTNLYITADLDLKALPYLLPGSGPPYPSPPAPPGTPRPGQTPTVPSLPVPTPSPSSSPSSSPGGLCPPLCLAPDANGGSNRAGDRSWTSLYTTEGAA